MKYFIQFGVWVYCLFSKKGTAKDTSKPIEQVVSPERLDGIRHSIANTFMEIKPHCPPFGF
jgi:hypothetical protein